MKFNPNDFWGVKKEKKKYGEPSEGLYDAYQYMFNLVEESPEYESLLDYSYNRRYDALEDIFDEHETKIMQTFNITLEEFIELIEKVCDNL